MLRISETTVVLALLITVAESLHAQGRLPDSVAIQAARATLRSDLRNFVTAQEAYFADHGTTLDRSVRCRTAIVPMPG